MFDFSNKEIVYIKGKNIEYIQFKKLLKYNIMHAYTLKGENINFRYNSEDEKESYNKICNEMKIDENTIVTPVQTHTGNIKCIDKITERKDLQDIDGLITNQKNIALVTKNADCILFLFYDPIKKVIANVHSGWKGTFQKIVEKTVIKMINNYKCNPKDIICCISPSIRKCHFEVDNDVKELCEYILKFTGKIEEFIEIGEIKDNKQKYMIDTIKINKILLKEIGIKDKNIIDCNLCSVCNKDKINSRRNEGMEFKLATAIISM